MTPERKAYGQHRTSLLEAAYARSQREFLKVVDVLLREEVATGRLDVEAELVLLTLEVRPKWMVWRPTRETVLGQRRHQLRGEHSDLSAWMAQQAKRTAIAHCPCALCARYGRPYVPTEPVPEPAPLQIGGGVQPSLFAAVS